MKIQVSFVGSKSGLIEKTFEADFDRYFEVNPELKKAAEFVKGGIAWEGSESFGSFLRIQQA